MFFLKKKQPNQENSNSQNSSIGDSIPVPGPELTAKDTVTGKEVAKKSKGQKDIKSKKSDPLEESFNNYAKDSASVENTENVFENINKEMTQVEKEIKETQKNLDSINAELVKLEKSRK